MGRVSKGKDLAGVRGIYKNINTCINTYIYEKYMSFPSELFVFSIYNGILHIMRVLLTHFDIQKRFKMLNYL